MAVLIKIDGHISTIRRSELTELFDSFDALKVIRIEDGRFMAIDGNGMLLGKPFNREASQHLLHLVVGDAMIFEDWEENLLKLT